MAPVITHFDDALLMTASLPTLIAKVQKDQRPVVVSNDKRVYQLEDEVRALKKDIQRLLKDNQESKDDAQQVQKQNSRLRFDYTRSKNDALAIARLKAEMKRAAKQQEDQVMLLESKLREAMERAIMNEQASQRLGLTEQEFNSQSDQLHAIDNDNQRLRAAARQQEKEIEDLKELCKNLETLLADARHANTLLRHKLPELRQKLEVAAEEHKNLRQTNANTRQELQQTTAHLSSQLVDTKKANAVLSEENSSNAAKAAKLQQELSEENVAHQATKDKLSQIAADFEATRLKKTKLARELQGLTKENKALQRKLDDYTKMEAQQQKAVEKARKLVDGMRRFHGLAVIGMQKGKEVEVQVASVAANSPGQEAGFLEEDVVIEVNGALVAGPNEFLDAINLHTPGEKVFFTIRRGEKTRKSLVMTLGASDLNHKQVASLIHLSKRAIRTATQIKMGGAAQYIDPCIEHILFEGDEPNLGGQAGDKKPAGKSKEQKSHSDEEGEGEDGEDDEGGGGDGGEDEDDEEGGDGDD